MTICLPCYDFTNSIQSKKLCLIKQTRFLRNFLYLQIMFKSYRKLIVLLFILASAKALGQSSGSAFEIFVRKYTSFSPVDSYTENRYLSAHHLPDTLNIKITSPAQLQGVLRAGLTDKVYSVEIDNSAIPDLNNIIALLIKFHNLEFLKISDPLFARSTQTEYKLPPIIQQLQQLKALELFYTNKLDMDDAVEKIASLNELEVLV